MEWLNSKLMWFDLDDNRGKIARYGLIALGVFVAAMVVSGMLSKARAEGVSKRPSAIKVAEAPAAKRTWTGIYGGGFGGFAMGELSGPGPIGMSSSGPTAGVNAGFTIQTGALVFGGEIAHAWFFGDLKDVGVEREIEYTGRVGVLLNPATLLYGHVSFAQLHHKYVDVEGWKFGPGVEIKTAAEGWSIDLRGGYAIYDVEGIMPGVDANILWGRVGLVRRFDMPAGWLGQ